MEFKKGRCMWGETKAVIPRETPLSFPPSEYDEMSTDHEALKSCFKRPPSVRILITTGHHLSTM